MNLTHLQLLMNHLPVVGTISGLSLLIFALQRRSNDLKRAALFRGERVVPPWFAATALIGSLVVAGLLGWTANLGGQVRHSEIRPSPSSQTQMQRDHD
jgi:hypothetical protein